MDNTQLLDQLPEGTLKTAVVCIIIVAGLGRALKEPLANIAIAVWHLPERLQEARAQRLQSTETARLDAQGAIIESLQRDVEQLAERMEQLQERNIELEVARDTLHTYVLVMQRRHRGLAEIIVEAGLEIPEQYTWITFADWYRHSNTKTRGDPDPSG